MAATAAAEMCAGVGWSGSPTLKSRTSAPFAFRAAARWAMATVGETSMARARRERSVAEPLARLHRVLRRDGASGARERPYFSRRRRSTTGGTSSRTTPPSWKTSLTSREDR